MDHVLDSREKFIKFWVGFLKKLKTPKSHSEIIWPLVLDFIFITFVLGFVAYLHNKKLLFFAPFFQATYIHGSSPSAIFFYEVTSFSQKKKRGRGEFCVINWHVLLSSHTTDADKFVQIWIVKWRNSILFRKLFWHNVRKNCS